jgi:hypothetical protein
MRGSAGVGDDLLGLGGVAGVWGDWMVLGAAKNSFVDFDRSQKILLEFKASLIAA